MGTAQDAYATMMKEHVAPELRALGFKGSGQAFTLPSPGYFAQLGFQKSAYSDSSEVRVTVNVSVISLAAWKEARAQRSHLRDKPSPSRFYGSFAWQQRIGELLPDGEDKWWLVSEGGDASVIANEIIAAVRDYALPEMLKQIASA